SIKTALTGNLRFPCYNASCPKSAAGAARRFFMKRCKNKRKLAVLGLAAAMALSLAACGEKRPSQEDVEQSIEAGTLTIEDALDKGWVDQAWVDAYYEENSVPAASKTESNMVGDFATTTLSGEAFTREQLGDVVFFAFLDP
ncbi:DUF4340 domain-containing protein, partial [Dysosmobacter welbionis]